MIKVIKERTSINPHYRMTFHYMIGDADGYTNREIKCPLDNPHIERVVTVLNNLKAPPGHWGVILDQTHIDLWEKHKMLSEEDLTFINCLVNYDSLDSLDEELDIFREGICADGEYFFLVFEGVDLKYVDENGFEYETEIV